MIWTKGAHQRAKLQSFDCSRKVSPNLYFDRLLLLKVYKISAKKVQKSYVSWTWRGMQNLKNKWFVISKMTRIWRILTQAFKSLINLHFHWFKSLKFDLKKYRRVVFHYTEKWCKIWRKLTCGLKNDMRTLANFH